MKTYSATLRILGDEELMENVDEAVQCHQSFHVGNGVYQITSANSEPHIDGVHKFLAIEFDKTGCENDPEKSELDRANDSLNDAISWRYQAFKRDRSTKTEPMITTFYTSDFIQQVMNLGAGYPASAVANALDQAADFVRNQDVEWSDEK